MRNIQKLSNQIARNHIKICWWISKFIDPSSKKNCNKPENDPSSPNCWRRMEECVVCSSYILYRQSINSDKNMKKITRGKENSTEKTLPLCFYWLPRKKMCSSRKIRFTMWHSKGNFYNFHRRTENNFLHFRGHVDRKVSVQLWTVTDCCWFRAL